MKGDEIPGSDHLALHCQQNAGLEVDPQGIPVSITSEAFRVDDDGISTNWIEFDGGDLEVACLLLATTRRVRKSHGVAKFNVGEVVSLGQTFQKRLSAQHDPIDPPDPRPNPGHSLIVGILSDDKDLLDSLAVLGDVSLYSEKVIKLSKKTFP